MDALSNEVEAFGLALVIQMLEFCSPLEKDLVGRFESLPCDPASIEGPNANDKLAVVLIVSLRKYPVEQVRS